MMGSQICGTVIHTDSVRGSVMQDHNRQFIRIQWVFTKSAALILCVPSENINWKYQFKIRQSTI